MADDNCCSVAFCDVLTDQISANRWYDHVLDLHHHDSIDGATMSMHHIAILRHLVSVHVDDHVDFRQQSNSHHDDCCRCYSLLQRHLAVYSMTVLQLKRKINQWKWHYLHDDPIDGLRAVVDFSRSVLKLGSLKNCSRHQK